jgi:ethanolamine utilization protein EutS
MCEGKQRIIQEYVPGKQVTLAHLISNPNGDLYKKLGIMENVKGAIGILTITPSEGAIIAADLATKTADVEIVFMDRFNGSVVIAGDTASVESALTEVLRVLKETLHFAETVITHT